MTQTPPVDDDRRPGLKPPQFGLGTLFLAMTLLCVFLVTIRAAGPLAGGVLLILIMAVIAHVSANALGCQLRANGDTRPKGPGEPSSPRPRRPAPRCRPATPAPRRAVRSDLRRSTVILSLVGASVGAAAGGWLLFMIKGESATWASIAIGTVSFGVLGGLWGFWMSSLLRVVCVAWVRAHRETDDRCDRPVTIH